MEYLTEIVIAVLSTVGGIIVTLIQTQNTAFLRLFNSNLTWKLTSKQKDELKQHKFYSFMDKWETFDLMQVLRTSKPEEDTFSKLILLAMLCIKYRFVKDYVSDFLGTLSDHKNLTKIEYTNLITSFTGRIVNDLDSEYRKYGIPDLAIKKFSVFHTPHIIWYQESLIFDTTISTSLFTAVANFLDIHWLVMLITLSDLKGLINGIDWNLEPIKKSFDIEKFKHHFEKTKYEACFNSVNAILNGYLINI